MTELCAGLGDACNVPCLLQTARSADSLPQHAISASWLAKTSLVCKNEDAHKHICKYTNVHVHILISYDQTECCMPVDKRAAGCPFCHTSYLLNLVLSKQKDPQIKGKSRHLRGVGLQEYDGARLAGRHLLQVCEGVRRTRARVPLHARAAQRPPQLHVHVLLVSLRQNDHRPAQPEEPLHAPQSVHLSGGPSAGSLTRSANGHVETS